MKGIIYMRTRTFKDYEIDPSLIIWIPEIEIMIESLGTFDISQQAVNGSLKTNLIVKIGEL